MSHQEETILTETLPEPNFMEIVKANQAALDDALQRSLFSRRGMSFEEDIMEFDSVDAWLSKHLTFTEDEPEVLQLAEKLDAAVEGLAGTYTIIHSYESSAALYRKQG